jgi:hypothetical protein
MEQMVEYLVAAIEKMDGKIDTNLKEMNAGQEHLKEEMRTSQELLKEEMLAKMETNQERMDAKIDAHHKRMMARMYSQLENLEVALDIFEERLKKMDTTDLEVSREKSESVMEQQGVPK